MITHEYLATLTPAELSALAKTELTTAELLMVSKNARERLQSTTRKLADLRRALSRK